MSSFFESDLLFAYKNVSQFSFCFVYIKTCALSFDDGSHCNCRSYTKTNSFAKHFYIHKQQKNQSCLRTEYRELSWAIKYIFSFLQIFNNSIATKLCVNLINNCRIFLEYFSALHNSIIKLCSAFFKCENKLKQLVEKINAQFWSAFKW